MNSQWVDAGDDAGERGFAGAGRAPENDGAEFVALDLAAQGLAGAEDVLLADVIFEALGAHALGQRAVLVRRGAGSLRAEWNRTGSRPHGPLPARFVEQDAGGHGGVEGFDADGGNGDVERGRAQRFADAARFVADDQAAARRSDRHRATERTRGVRRARARRRTVPPCSAAARRAPARRPRRAGRERGTGSRPRRAGSWGSTGSPMPLRNRMPVAPKASAARAMAPALPGSCRPSRTTTSAQPRNNCSSFQTGGLTSAMTPWLVSVPESRWRRASGSTTTLDARQAAHVRFGGRAHGFGGQHDLHFAIAAQGFFEQVERLGHAPALVGEAAAHDGAAHVLQQRIGGAGDRLGLRHPTIMVLKLSE